MQSNKIAEALKIQMITTFKGRYGALYLVFRYQFLLRSQAFGFEISIENLQLFYNLQRSRSQAVLIAIEATRPSGASTVETDRTEEKCGSFLRSDGAEEVWACSSVG